jgi:glycerophosphoryl diester phosphodiesterase
VTIAIAHRGDPLNHRENTLDAFTAAAALGADMVELDCKLTSDGHVVVLHDHTLRRLWAVDRPVASLTWEEVSVVRRDGYRIPDLAQVLGTVALPVMVDVPSTDVLEASLAVVEAAGALERCIFAGETAALVRLRKMSPAARVALSWDKRQLPSAELLLQTKPEWFNPSWHLANRAVVDRMHADGIGVSVWTVDRPWQMKRMLAAGVDAVISNQAARLVSVLGRPAPAS